MGQIVVRPEAKPQQILGLELPNPFDWESFQWGMAAGGIIVTIAGTVVLYFTWPYVLAAFQAFPFFKEMAATYKTLTT